MAEREIKIGFPEVKMEALEFFLKENDTITQIYRVTGKNKLHVHAVASSAEEMETLMREHLDKTYEKSVPQQVRKFVESKMIPQTEEPAQNEAGNARQGRGQGRRSTRQQTARETVLEQENNGAEQDSETEEQEPEQEQTGGMSMSM